MVSTSLSLLLLVSASSKPQGAGVPPAAEPDGLRAAIVAHFNAQADESNRRWHGNVPHVDPRDLRFKFGLADLSGEGRQDAVVLFTDRCGSGGCTLEIFRQTERGFRFVSGTTLAYAPVRVTLARDKYGWKSLIISTRYYGDAVLRFNGWAFPLLSDNHPAATKEELRSSSLLIPD